MPTLEHGFTLPEVMLAMAFGSLIALAAAKALPVLRQHSSDVGRHYRLELVLRQLAFNIEKDLRRSGFCAGQCQGKVWLIGNAAGEVADSCVIVAYDLNRNGRWESAGTEAEYFGYRLRTGALEGQRGVSQCAGGGWERLLDREEVQVDTFSVSKIAGESGRSLVLFSLTGHAVEREDIRQRLDWAISLEAP